MRAGRTRALILAGLLAAAAGPARAAPAPPPPGWTSEGDEGQDDYRAPPPLRGLYGHGFSDPFDSSCEGDQAAQATFSAHAPAYTTEFWLYSTGAQAILLRRSVVTYPVQPCTQPLQYTYETRRAFVVDGRIQSFTQGEDGAVTMLESRASDRRDGEYSGEFSPLANLLARGVTPSGRIRRNTRIAGLQAQCWSNPGLVWSTVCQSRAPGRSYGMILKAEAGDDERQMFGMEFDAVDTSATIDGRLFELERSWRGPR
jgi:hypothetical protein